MVWAFRRVVAAAGVLLSCAGTLADPPVSTDDSGDDDSRVSDPREAGTVGDSDGAEAREPSESPKYDDSGAAVVATLRTRDSELTILSAGGTMHYALVDASGDAKTLSLDQLRAHDQNLFEVVTAAMARGVSGSAGTLDAKKGAAGSSSAMQRSGLERRSPRGAFIDARLDHSLRPKSSDDIRAERGALGLPRGTGVPPRD
jgi:hypothetical protein